MDPFLLLLIGLAVILVSILVFRLNPVLSLLFAAIVVGALTGSQHLIEYASLKEMSPGETERFLNLSVGRRIAGAFGNTAANIGILIAMAAVIGTCLLRSGAAERIIRAILGLFGEKRIPSAFLSSGFILGIPVFFDTVFYLLVPLTKALALRTGRNYLFYLMAVIAGAAMAHSLVPPTPGPLFVATEMGVDLGIMIIGGLTIGLFTITGGYLYSRWANRKWPVPVRDTEEVSVDELEEMRQKDTSHLPGLGISLLPILLPLLLISGNTISGALMEEGPLRDIFAFVGDSNIAMTMAAALSLILLVRQVRDQNKLKKYVTESLQNAGLIVLITSMGGAFGGMLQQTGIGVRIQELSGVSQMALLPLAFLVTALMKTAQGSATVSMITAVGILGGLVTAGDLAFHPVYLALAIGCGSKPIPWMNDSGFWVVCKMSGLTEKETLKTFSVLLSIMGVVGLVAILILARLFPMV